MTDPTKWWLISDEDVQVIREGLTGSLLHTLESGLHITDAVPSDYQSEDEYTGLIPDKRFYCGWRFDHYSCGGMAVCKDTGQLEECKKIRSSTKAIKESKI